MVYLDICSKKQKNLRNRYFVREYDHGYRLTTLFKSNDISSVKIFLDMAGIELDFKTKENYGWNERGAGYISHWCIYRKGDKGDKNYN